MREKLKQFVGGGESACAGLPRRPDSVRKKLKRERKTGVETISLTDPDMPRREYHERRYRMQMRRYEEAVGSAR